MDYTGVYIIVILAFGLIWGGICQAVASSKHRLGFWWGFFLGLIGLIVVLCLPSKEAVDGGASNNRRVGNLDPDRYEHLAQIAELRKQGVLTDEEFEEEKQIILGKGNVGGSQRMPEGKSKSVAKKHDYDAMDSDDEYYDDEF